MDNQKLRKLTIEELDNIICEQINKGSLSPHMLYPIYLNGVDLSGLDLSSIEFNNVHITNSNLEKCNLSYSDLEIVEFNNCNLKNTNFALSRLTGVTFNHSDLEAAYFYRTNMNYGKFNSSNLKKTEFRCNTFNNVDIVNSNFDEADFYNSSLHKMYDAPYVSVGNIGIEDDTTYYLYNSNKVLSGGFNGTMEEFEKNINEKYGKCENIGQEICYKEYKLAIETLKKLAEIKKYRANKKEEFDLYKENGMMWLY